jgi:hypothetical protein
MMDEAAGPFIRLLQCGDSSERGEIRIDLDEWGAIKEAADTMLTLCMKEQANINIKEKKNQ